MLWLILLLCLLLLWQRRISAPREFQPRRKATPRPSQSSLIASSYRKPAWVAEAVIERAIRHPGRGCRYLAQVFNRDHAAAGGMTVGKTYVADMLRKHHRRIARQRQQWRQRVPRAMSSNAIWAADLTGLPTTAGRSHLCLGLIDHGSRALLSLTVLRDKSSITLLRLILSAIERHGRPQAIRTDNEAVFTSRLFAFGLRWLGIRHQRTHLHCPWQNGRIERFFGTLKREWRGLRLNDSEQLNLALMLFRVWYNQCRPHQALAGKTPAEAWATFPRIGEASPSRRRRR